MAPSLERLLSLFKSEGHVLEGIFYILEGLLLILVLQSEDVFLQLTDHFFEGSERELLYLGLLVGGFEDLQCRGVFLVGVFVLGREKGKVVLGAGV